MFIRENQIFKNDTFAVSRMLFTSSSWENMTIIERLAIIQLSGIAADQKLILTFNTLELPLSENEIIAPESFLSKYLGIESKDLDTLLSNLSKLGLLEFKTGFPDSFSADANDQNLQKVDFPYPESDENAKFYKICLHKLHSGTNDATPEKTAPSVPEKIKPSITIDKKITPPVQNKANDTKISIEQFSIGEYPEARADAAEYIELYGLTLEQYEGALLKFCRMKSQSGYLHMNHFMFKCQFNLYIKKNLKHIIV